MLAPSLRIRTSIAHALALAASALVSLAPRPARAQATVSIGDGDAYHGPDAVHLRIEADDAGVMRLVEKTGAEWTTRCALPCQTTANPHGVYRIEGDSYANGGGDDDDDGAGVDKVGQSGPFRLGPSSDQFLMVHPRSAYAQIVGWVFVPIGAGFTGLGAAALGGALDKPTGFRLGFGLPFVVGGAAFLGVGGYFLLRHGTSVTDEAGHRNAGGEIKLVHGVALGPRGLTF